METSVEEIKSKVDAAMESLPIDRKFYFNGFSLAISPTDISILIQQNNQVVALITTSHAMAKTLMINLTNAINDLEKNIGTQILTLEEVVNRINEEIKKQADKKDSP